MFVFHFISKILYFNIIFTLAASFWPTLCNLEMQYYQRSHFRTILLTCFCNWKIILTEWLWFFLQTVGKKTFSPPSSKNLPTLSKCCPHYQYLCLYWRCRHPVITEHALVFLSLYLFHFSTKICARFSSLETHIIELKQENPAATVKIRGSAWNSAACRKL